MIHVETLQPGGRWTGYHRETHVLRTDRDGASYAVDGGSDWFRSDSLTLVRPLRRLTRDQAAQVLRAWRRLRRARRAFSNSAPQTT